MGRRLIVEADGGSRGNPGPAGYGALVRDAGSGEVLAEVAESIGVASNNVAEYRGLIAGLRAAASLDPAEVEVRMDSKLVVEQMSGRWRVKHPDMKTLAAEAASIVRQLPAVRFRHVPREQNGHADRLANEAMDAAARGERWRMSGELAPEPARPAPDPSTATTTTTTWLVRHGQTEMSAQRRFSGAGDPPLTALGERQAAAVAERLRGQPAAAVLCSPLRRALDTASAVARVLGGEPEIDEDLRETDFGDWEGHTFAEVQRGWPEQMRAWLADPQVAPPGGESFSTVAQRVQRAQSRIVERFAGCTVVVVSHVTPIKTLLRFALEAPPQVLYRIHLDLAAVSLVDWYPDRALVRLVNDAAHTASLT